MAPVNERTPSTTPLKIFSAGLALTIIVIIAMFIFALLQYRAFSETEERIARLHDLTSKVRELDDYENQLFVQAVIRLDPATHSRFEQSALDHETALDEAQDLARGPATEKAIEATLAAHEALHAQELAVYDNLLAGDTEAVGALISDPAYIQNVNDYYASVDEMSQAIQTNMDEDIESSHARILVITLLIAVVLVMIAGVWFFVIRTVRQYIRDRDAAEKKMRMAMFSVASASDAIYWIGPDARFIYVNDEACRSLGYSRDQLLEMTVHDIDPLLTTEVWPDYWEELRRQGSLTIESIHRRKDGTEFPVEIAINYLQIGDSGYNFAFARNVTVRKQLQAELLKHQERLDRSQQIARIGSWEYDLRTGSLWWSDEVYRMLGLEDGAPVTVEQYLEMVHPDDREQLRQEIESGEQHRSDYRVIRTDGEVRYFRQEVGEPLLEDGKPVVNRGTAQDVTEHKSAELALRESAERLRLMFESMEEIVWAADVPPGGNPLESPLALVSPSVSSIFGYTPDDLIADPSIWFGAIHPDDVEAINASMERIIASGKPGTRTYRLRKKDSGTYVWLEEIVSPRIGQDGRIIGLFGVARDITTRKRNEELLLGIVEGISGTGMPFFRSLVAQMRKALDADIAFIGELNVEKDIVATIAVDNHGEPGDNFEYPLEHTPCRNVIGKEPCIYPEGVQSQFPRDRDLVEMGIEGYVGTPLFDSGGRPLGIIVALFHDPIRETAIAESLLQIFATRAAAELERMVVEEELGRSEERYRTLFEETKDAVFMASLEGRFVDMNPSGIEMLGYDSLEEVRQLDLATEVYADADDLERYQRDLAEAGYVKDYEIRLKRKDGEIRTFSVTSTLVRDEDGNITGNWGIGRDITRHRELEEQLVQAQKMESIGRLAGGVAHDFNNFLTAVQGYIEMAISDLPLNSPVKPELVEAARSADRAVDVTRQLLLFSRHGRLNLRPVNLNSIVSGIENMLNRLIGEQFVIETSLDPRIATVRADPGHMEQVLLNLVVNARDAMPEGGRIIIGTQNLELDEPVKDMEGIEHFGEYACLWVKDEGNGMDDSTRAKIFEPFFSTKSVGTGTGLGLSVVYGLVEQHNGWVEVESLEGTGSTFRVYLPVADETMHEEDENTTVPQNQLRGRGERILLVEDEEIVRNLAVKMLSESGYSVTEAGDANEATAAFSKDKDGFDLLFCDVVLPGIPGLRLADELVALDPRLKVLMVSGYTGESVNRGQIIERGYGFIPKPYTLADLLLEIKRMLEPGK